jgi:hypothetical protein
LQEGSATLKRMLGNTPNFGTVGKDFSKFARQHVKIYSSRTFVSFQNWFLLDISSQGSIAMLLAPISRKVDRRSRYQRTTVRHRRRVVLRSRKQTHWSRVQKVHRDIITVLKHSEDASMVPITLSSYPITNVGKKTFELLHCSPELFRRSFLSAHGNYSLSEIVTEAKTNRKMQRQHLRLPTGSLDWVIDDVATAISPTVT